MVMFAVFTFDLSTFGFEHMLIILIKIFNDWIYYKVLICSPQSCMYQLCYQLISRIVIQYIFNMVLVIAL